MEPKCIRCGKCCHWKDGDKVVKCKFLIRLKNGKTICRVYSTRLNRIIGQIKPNQVVRCRERKEVPYDIPGCPYNCGKPIDDTMENK